MRRQSTAGRLAAILADHGVVSLVDSTGRLWAQAVWTRLGADGAVETGADWEPIGTVTDAYRFLGY